MVIHNGNQSKQVNHMKQVDISYLLELWPRGTIIF